ncbi:MAG: transposase [Actinomycetia bacterium]|nr:transposase [Actinomycetes bacterium]
MHALALTGWVAARSWTSGDGPKVIFGDAVGWLRERNVLLPGDEARVVLVEPDAEQFRAVIGRRSVSSLLDPARRAPAARAGRRHGLEVASQVAAVWND